jgi:hypothetical protein
MQLELFHTPKPTAKCPFIWELLDQDQKQKIILAFSRILQNAITAEQEGASNER